MSEKRPPGLYDEPMTLGLEESLRAGDLRALVEGLDEHTAPAALARHVHGHVLRVLRDTRDPAEQVALANHVLGLLAQSRDSVLANDHLRSPPSRLRALSPPNRLGADAFPERPSLPLDATELLVNGPKDLRIGREVVRELASADRVDLLCSFLKFSGLRLVRHALADFLKRRPGGLRVLTTTYMGATERRALDELVDMGATVQLSYDKGRTRLHAKAWLFYRETGFSTAYIGSSNLSAAALLDGLEWNVRVSNVQNATVLRKFSAAFEHYWNDPEFQPYTATPEHRHRFDESVRRQVRATNAAFMALRVRPHTHQEQILEALDAERARGHTRNLVVAATGTGKTVVAALDFKRLRKADRSLSLLFVAHREEILKQALATYQVVLGDPAFGELLVGGLEPSRADAVFASIGSLHAGRLASIPPDAYDVVVVDECHHAPAASYERLLRHLRPKVLLGLTATPERMDGQPVARWFDDRIAAEIRLWQALESGLLAPFQYFAVNDGTELANAWRNGRYVGERVENVYTATDVWVQRVLQAVRTNIGDAGSMRALGFCVTKNHARFMADRFSLAGLPSIALTSDTSRHVRAEAISAFRAGDLRVLFTVDLFNEGVDLPAADTVLFLRPTNSSTVFLQQLGRGLRLHEDKECLTVLDFVGHPHRADRMEARYRAMLGMTRKELQQAVEDDFPRLPPGCSIQLDRVAKQIVLNSIRRAVNAGVRGLVQDLQAIAQRTGGDVTLSEFLRLAKHELADLYSRPGRSWTDLRRRAGLPTPAPAQGEAAWLRALPRMLHIDDNERLVTFHNWLGSDAPPSLVPGSADERLAWMLMLALGDLQRPARDVGAFLAELWPHGAVRSELVELLECLDARVRRRTWGWRGEVPLRVHGSYSLDEIMAGMGATTKKTGAIYRPRGQGVYYSHTHRADLFFVTLQKEERDYSPTTLYDDYVVSPDTVHWESQGGTHEHTDTGHRYIHHERLESAVLLFIRTARKDARGQTLPYVFLGPATYVSHAGGRPMSVRWRLAREMPPELYQRLKLVAG